MFSPSAWVFPKVLCFFCLFVLFLRSRCFFFYYPRGIDIKIYFSPSKAQIPPSSAVRMSRVLLFCNVIISRRELRDFCCASKTFTVAFHDCRIMLDIFRMDHFCRETPTNQKRPWNMSWPSIPRQIIVICGQDSEDESLWVIEWL